MDNGEPIPVSSDDEVLVDAAEAAEVASSESAAREEAAAREAAHIVAVRGPYKKKGPAQIFYKFCVFPSCVSLNQSQVKYLNKVSKKRPYIPLYVCTVQNAMFDDTKGKMYFSKNYTLANIRRHLKLPAKVTVLTRKENCGKVQMIMSKGKGKGAQITTDWKKVVKATKMQIGNIVMFWFHRSRDGLKLAVKTLM